METVVINIPDKKSAFVKQLLKELGVTITSSTKTKTGKNVPNAITKQTIDDARNGVGLNEPIKNISDFITSL